MRLLTTTTLFQHAVTTLSLHNQISTSSKTTSLQHLKSLLPRKIIIFCYFILNSARNKFHWLTNYIHYLTNSRPIQLHAFHFTHLNQPLNYTALLHYSHTPNTHTKLQTSHTPSTSTPKYTLTQRLIIINHSLLRTSPVAGSDGRAGFLCGLAYISF